MGFILSPPVIAATGQSKYDIRVVKVDGSNAPGVRISPEWFMNSTTPGYIWGLCWSPDGEEIIFSMASGMDLYGLFTGYRL